VEEALKWSAPAFTYHGMMCGMLAFKNHCAFHFWKGELVVGKRSGGPDGAAAQFGKLTSVKDLPPKKVLQGYIKKAMELNAAGVAVPKGPAKPKKALVMPKEFMAAIEKNKKALATFEQFSPSHQREYIEWIDDAKTDATRDRRIAQAVEWMTEGKPRNWKYMR
jgi:uncharacterized protein YdeI (YjbR/CyaY-like superfamily)